MTQPDTMSEIDKKIEEAADKAWRTPNYFEPNICGEMIPYTPASLAQRHRKKAAIHMYKEACKWALEYVKSMNQNELKNFTGKCNCNHRLCPVCG